MTDDETPPPGSDEALDTESERYYDPEPMSDEEFRDIEGFEDLYQVSNLGRVRSLRYYGHDGKTGILTPRWQTTSRNNGRYATVRLIDTESDKDKNYHVSRLVASAFVPNPEEKPEVNHKNGDTEDDRAENLEWVTSSENQKHAIENGLADEPPGTKGRGTKYAWENDDGCVFWGTPAELAREDAECDEAYLYKIVNDDHPHHKSHKGWEVVETPPPGSDKARDMGGRCPVLDNAHGAGYMGTDRYVISMDCPLHGQAGDDYVMDLSDAEAVVANREACVNREYACGHLAYGPPKRLPEECPECGAEVAHAV